LGDNTDGRTKHIQPDDMHAFTDKPDGDNIGNGNRFEFRRVKHVSQADIALCGQLWRNSSRGHC
jgi:hypothetical protein